MILTLEDKEFLKHYGVKGMKWGVRRDQATLDRLAGGRNLRKAQGREGGRAEKRQQKSDWKDYKRSTTRKERRTDARQARETKVKHLIEEATKNPRRAIVISSEGSIPTLTTGKQFIDHMMKGGAVDVNATNLTNMEFDLKDE